MTGKATTRTPMRTRRFRAALTSRFVDDVPRGRGPRSPRSHRGRVPRRYARDAGGRCRASPRGRRSRCHSARRGGRCPSTTGGRGSTGSCVPAPVSPPSPRRNPRAFNLPSRARRALASGTTSSGRRNQNFATTDCAVHLSVQMDASDRSETVSFRSIDPFRNSVTPLGSPFGTGTKWSRRSIVIRFRR